MGFIMDGLDAESYDRQYTDGELVRRILNYFRPQAWRMGVVAIAILAVAGLETALPIYVSRALDQLEIDRASFNIILTTVVVVALAGGAWLLNAIRRWQSQIAVGEVVLQLREDAFDAVTERDLSFYDEFPTGKIVSRVTSDTQAFSETVTLATNLMSQFLLILILIGYLFSVNVTMTLIVLALTPFIVATALAFRRIARTTITESRRIMANVNAHVQETVSGIAVAKAFRKEKMVYNEFLEVNEQAYKVNLRTGFTFASIFPILVTISGVGTAIIVWYGIGLAQNTGLTAGEWFLFIQGLQLFWFPLTGIASFWSQFQLGLAAGERVFALLDAEPKVVQTGANKNIAPIRGEIEFKNLDFSYTESEQVLLNFSLNIPDGETLALVGHTGSGKSSIAKLVARFYEYQDGQLCIDGHDIRSLDIHAYRQELGVVTQTPFLFEGTVMDNIRYGREDFIEDNVDSKRDSRTESGFKHGDAHATDEEVIAAAHLVAGGDWIKSLPEGLHTPVGERGSNLSLGQRQLVSLARVLLQNPTILILDEATASIDPLTEALIQEGLEEVMKGRTAIVIAHRLSTIQAADRIIVLRKGEIIEEGNHASLMDSDGHYAELYNTYFRHQSLEYIEQAAALAS